MFCCHQSCVEAIYKPCDPMCCCCEVCCQTCCCCCSDETYMYTAVDPGSKMQGTKAADDPEGTNTSSKSFGSKKSKSGLDRYQKEAAIAISRNSAWYSTSCWMFRGYCGEGSNWAILRDAKLNEERKPFVT